MSQPQLVPTSFLFRTQLLPPPASCITAVLWLAQYVVYACTTAYLREGMMV